MELRSCAEALNEQIVFFGPKSQKYRNLKLATEIQNNDSGRYAISRNSGECHYGKSYDGVRVKT